MTEPALEVQGLAYAYPDGHQALFGVDLRIERGERVALLGPNGAGKTTLVLRLNGILQGGAGTVRVGGVQLAKSTVRDVRRRVGIVFQDPDDQLFLPTVREDVAFGPANLGLRGLERLRLPSVLVQILGFMIRYADVVGGELRRMRVARESRGFRARHLGALKVLGPAAGSLFIRSYERGERVHLAMLSRGYTGRLPSGPVAAVPARDWATGLALPLAAAAVLAAGMLLG